MANTVHGVLYLERDKFLLSLDSRADVLSYVFPPKAVSNLDILDSDGLKQSLADFIKQNKIVVNNLIIVLSNAVIFEQDFKTEQEGLVQEFLDNVPYETISIKKIPITGGTKVLIGNATFYTLVADVFKQNGCHLDFVIPEKALGGPIGAFNASTARLILTQQEALSKFQFVVDATTENTTDFKPPERKKVVVHKKNYTLLYTLPVFVLLIIVLAVMMIQQMTPQKKATTSALASTIPTVRPLAPTTQSTTQEVVPTAAVLKKISSVQIVYDPSSSAKADEVRAALTNLGIANIQTSTAVSDLAAPIVAVSTAIDPIEKQKVADALKKIYPTTSIQDSSAQQSDVIITIGKTR